MMKSQDEERNIVEMTQEQRSSVQTVRNTEAMALGKGDALGPLRPVNREWTRGHLRLWSGSSGHSAKMRREVKSFHQRTQGP